MAKARGKTSSNGDHRCKTCGRKLAPLVLKRGKLEKLEEKLGELNEKLATKSTSKKADKWNRRIARIRRRLDAHEMAAQALA